MKPPKLLGVILKVIGVWSVVSAIASLPRAFAFWNTLYSRQEQLYTNELELFLLFADTFAGPIILIVASWFLLRRTDTFIRLTYSPATLRDSEVPSDDQRAQEMFGILVKAIGYWEILSGLMRLPYEIGLVYRMSPVTLDAIAYYGILIVAGCFLVFATDWFVRFAYPPARNDDESQDETSTESSNA